MLLKLAVMLSSLLPCQEKLWDHFYNLLHSWGGRH